MGQKLNMIKYYTKNMWNAGMERMYRGFVVFGYKNVTIFIEEIDTRCVSKMIYCKSK